MLMTEVVSNEISTAQQNVSNAMLVLADPDDERSVDRSEAQDLSAWND